MLALVRVRGEVDTTDAVRDTLQMLNLNEVNHCTLVPETDAYRGMVTKVHDRIAFGEPSVETVAALVRRRGEPLEGDADIDDDWVADNTGHADVDALAEALVAEETTLREAGLSPALRLHPPRGGHDGIKRPVVAGGELGGHDDIDGLLEVMR
ncbi:MAG: LSU ribosomal protein L30P [uncultured archaeon A07HB70]|nr:MAG: LSU ribosomal protein L30P [uncultured archaeon A07HB70]